jgi:KipI family sensor histidine kinase inhibitor
VNFNILKITSADIIKIIESVDMAALLRQPFKYIVVEIPVCYEGEYGPDISRFKENGLSAEEVINLHSHQEYLVYMLGFMPGFPYLGGLDQKLHKERLETPRTRVPKGAVGIGASRLECILLNHREVGILLETRLFPYLTPNANRQYYMDRGIASSLSLLIKMNIKT